MTTVYFMVGIPASGKTTWARENLPGCAIVSTDAIREELFGTAEGGGHEELVFETAHRRVIEQATSGRDVVYDATNVSPAQRGKLLQKLQESGVDFRAVTIVIDVTPAEALRMQELRGRKVPAAAIYHFHRSLIPPTVEEGFSEVRHVRPGQESEPRQPDPDVPGQRETRSQCPARTPDRVS